MKEFQKKTKIRKKLCSNFVILLLVIILGFLIKGALGVYFKAREGRNILDIASEELSELESRSDRLKEDIDYLRSDVGKEEKLRNNFVVAKEGEQAIFIIDEEDEEVGEVQKHGTFRNIWERILNLVK